MSERPILMSGPMVRAILAGTKTKTRRVVKPAGVNECGYMHGPWSNAAGEMQEPIEWSFGSKGVGKHDPMNFFVDHTVRCPYGVPGDTLWVRETWATSTGLDHRKPSEMEKPGVGYGWPIWYGADDGAVTWRGSEGGGPAFTTRGSGRPSIHMPRWASRITLRVTSVRVERVQDISEEDIVAEGAAPERWLRTSRTETDGVARDGIRALWETLWIDINGRESWDANPFVWVVGFERVESATAQIGRAL